MKNFIYTTLLVFASLFCQAFGAQNGWPTFYDTICAKPGETIHMSDFKSQILELLQNREDSIWSECCDVTVELEREPQIAIDSKPTTGWPNLDIDKNMVVGVTVTYKRQLECTNLPRKEDAKTPASYAMWHLFGKLLSETEKGKVTKISDEASITTLHHATFFYRFELAFPDDILFEIINEDAEDFCLEDNLIWLKVPDEYSSCHLKWEIPYGIVFRKGNDTQSAVTLRRVTENYAYPIVCRATSCSGNMVSDTKIIGIQTPIPEVEDFGCIAANETSLKVEINNPNSQLSYHWTVENLEGDEIIDTQQGVSVTMAIPQKETVRLKLRSTGGCKDAEMEPMILHRSLVSDAHHIAMVPEPNCIFAGDTLRFSLLEAPDTLVWQIADNKELLMPHDTYNYQALQAKDNVVVSVYAKACPNDIIMDTFNIREDFSVSLGTSPMCISANEYQVIKLTSNGINPEVHWYGNGVDIDSTTYSTKDSILLRLTNPGDKNLYVAVKAKECGRERDTLLVLHPKPEKPLWDSLMEMFPPCIPLGIEGMIALRVQPQEGVKFRWSILEEEITEFDSNSIQVRVNYDLAERNAPIPVSVYAYTDGCPNNSDILQDTLYAIGAGLGEEWNVIQQIDIDEEFDEIWGYIIGFSDDDLFVKDYGSIDPFEGEYLFDWYVEDSKLGNNTGCSYYFMLDEVDESFDIFCKLTSKESQCYSVYSTTVGNVDMFKLQSVVPESRPDAKTGEKNDSETTSEEWLREKDDIPCPSIVLRPNPVRSGVQVKVEGICETESFTMECYSSQGRLMFRTIAKGDTFTIPTDNYAAGVYIVKIQPQGKASPVVKKLIIF